MSYIASKLIGYLRLMRPANIITAIADVLAGVAISGYFIDVTYRTVTLEFSLPVVCLCLAAAGLYGGGVVFNDVFDAKLDAIERPERPIPSGIISKTQAIILGAYLLLVGVLGAFSVGHLTGAPGWLAIAITLAALVYNKWGKHHPVWGPINMGLCRGFNLLLGISILPEALAQYWWMGIIPVIYIAAITNISRGEVHGGNTKSLKVSAVGYAVVYSAMIVLAIHQERLWRALPFILLFMFMVNTPLMKAMKEPSGPNLGKAVKGGILALIAMNAAWVAAFAQMPFAIFVLLLLPVSLGLGKLFAIT
ncbi:4-hydroxybenzoate polyprenyltransferase [Chitinophaga jiangningensis]|uniref:4-hydroxybenzoate polyprenyltransferase n=1 Tax=Chitinophaga jiangningensis TaxID=1419482 RepID=A0A1M6WTD1_9BACT|nr:UbiA-like protein EboC [Chitinophaga jiangningensis]SHK96901.1 4-hydroxybenzoate polyprenyltransferase [Chitinophaga jiangningensis]